LSERSKIYAAAAIVRLATGIGQSVCVAIEASSAKVGGSDVVTKYLRSEARNLEPLFFGEDGVARLWTPAINLFAGRRQRRPTK
jgi:hypothetical protein